MSALGSVSDNPSLGAFTPREGLSDTRHLGLRRAEGLIPKYLLQRGRGDSSGGFRGGGHAAPPLISAESLFSVYWLTQGFALSALTWAAAPPLQKFLAATPRSKFPGSAPGQSEGERGEERNRERERERERERAGADPGILEEKGGVRVLGKAGPL